ncbi:DUF4129 domain-containing protein [Endozoicomonas sp. SM1973]|uniref:DUF4129 domain-containing protein n=1 Tax=Spartinivicinus marinus TaxID=2994442 RepID=A0A853IDM7_9GAMM|nr:DUF4129 domain-containing protein [Spartinivicinus marinus]MCX4028881.1 DUF4129 domain-containing protein [Spartinivicinus marinus]NYZ65536.1 DUF4129 domain-containing protein [Spartinivicinus marinus]
MQLERIAFTARPRQSWEAADLGLQFTRQLYWRLVKLCFLITLPIYLLLEAIWPNTGINSLLIWWLKPLWERVILVVLSQAVFQSTPTTRQTLTGFKAIVWRQAFAAITWRRLSPSRSFNLPVIQLEGLKGKQYQSRLSILHRGHTSPAFWLTILGVHLESLISLSAFMIVIYILPNVSEFDEVIGLLEMTWLGSVLYYFSMLLVAPFYVASGFFLYLNRRIILEAWDIELIFRQMAARFKRSATSLNKAASLIFISGLIFSSLNPTQAVYAETFQTPEAAKTTIEEVLNGEDFHQFEKTKFPKLNIDWNWLFDDMELEDGEDKESGFLADLAVNIAPFLEVMLWSVVIALILLVTFRYRHWLLAFAKPTDKTKTKPDSLPSTLFGLDVSAESLPNDIPTSVMNLWQKQQHREAIGLLYRALLSQLINDYQIPITTGDTEGDCIHKTRPLANTTLSGYLQELTNVWLQLAYAHQLPTESTVNALCQRWQQLNTGVVNG